MGVDFSTLIYEPNFDMWARPITVTPAGSAPYTNRGIYRTQRTDVMAEDGSVVTDHSTLLYIREAEFISLPQQGDEVSIPADRGAMGALGDFEIINVWHNGGGQTTLQLRKLETAG